MHRFIARLASAERDGSLYLACGCASLAGAVAVIVSPSHILTNRERAMADDLAKNEALKATLKALKTPLSKDDQARLVEVAVAKAYEAEQEQRRSSIREGDLMAQAPLLQAVPGILSQSVMSDPKPTVAELRDNGVCRIDACLTPGVAATLLAHVNTSLADARSRVAVDGKQRDQDTFYKALKEAQPPPKVAGHDLSDWLRARVRLRRIRSPRRSSSRALEQCLRQRSVGTSSSCSPLRWWLHYARLSDRCRLCVRRCSARMRCSSSVPLWWPIPTRLGSRFIRTRRISSRVLVH